MSFDLVFFGGTGDLGEHQLIDDLRRQLLGRIGGLGRADSRCSGLGRRLGMGQAMEPCSEKQRDEQASRAHAAEIRFHGDGF